MKNPAQENANGNIENIVLSKKSVNTLEKQIRTYEQEKHILLELSNDFTKVREKNDLIKIFSSRLKGFFYFTHAVVSLIDSKKGTYYAFLIDKKAIPIKHRDELPALLRTSYEISDPFIGQIGDSEVPVSFLLDDIIDREGIPEFLRVNYDCGIRKAMIANLTNKMETFGYVFLYSDRTDSFSETFKNVLHRITPHLSNAVANIIINQKIEYREKVQKILLSLSNELVTVRNREDLSYIIKYGLSNLIYFTHSVMTVLSESGKTYEAFLIDPESRTRKFQEYTEMVSTPIPIEDGIYNVASKSHKTVVLDLTSMNMDNAPLWIKLNREAGIKEVLMKALTPEDTPKYNLILFSDRTNSFDKKAIDIIEQVSGQLATAAGNVSANEEIISKERDKSFLLEFSRNIASTRTKNDLSVAIHRSLKKLSQIKAYFIRILDEDGKTMSSFMFDEEVYYLRDKSFIKLLKTKIPVNNGVTAKVIKGNVPVFIDLAKEAKQGNTGIYIDFWKQMGPQKMGYSKMVGTPLQLGNKKLGILWIITDEINTLLLEGICAQISVAISNIRSNEEILQREEEKTKLLSLSQEIAALRNRAHLLDVVNTKIKALFSIEEFGIAQIDEDGFTYSAFIIDVGEDMKRSTGYDQVTLAKYKVTDPIFSRIMISEDPVLFDVNTLAQKTTVPAYVHLWKKAGVFRVLGMALRVGGKNIGCAFLHVPDTETGNRKSRLLKAVCAQLSVAVSNILANERVQAYKRMLEVENDYLKEQTQIKHGFSEIIGNGPGMQKVYKMISLVADSNSTILLLGETGTGKELIARAIHNASLRKDKLMVKVNCAALATNLIESELFGHERGAFTGATERRVGKFELANKGTLFLDEIGEMPLETQVKLLRVIQERELERVGGSNTIKVDVRIIAATNRNLEEEVKAGRFRSDLYYRLNVFPILLPPLRERMEDIEELANFFLKRYVKSTGKNIDAISPKVITKLKSYLWPGNIRELEHLMERSVLLSQGRILTEIQLPKNNNEPDGENLHLSNKTLEELERAYIIEILKRCNGKIAGNGGASEILNLPSTTLHSKIKKLEISKEEYFA